MPLVKVGSVVSPFVGTAAIDTGTSLIAMPLASAAWMNKQIGAKPSIGGINTVDCSNIPSMPSVTFNFGGNHFSLEAKDYIMQTSQGCISPFMGLDLGNLGELWIIGDTFLRKYYTIFDLGNNQVGFALAATNPTI